MQSQRRKSEFRGLSIGCHWQLFFFIVKFINRLEFFYCIVSKIWYSKYDNQSVCVDTYKITEKVI